MKSALTETSSPGATGPGLSQLIYRSQSLLEVSSGLQMSDILHEARAANARNGVTGVLTAVDGVFLQMIEGPDASLDRLLVKLARDRRHRDLRILERRWIKIRAFGDWDMVSPRLAPLEAAQAAHLLADDAGLDAFIPVLREAVARQDAVLEGRAAPPLTTDRVQPGLRSPTHDSPPDRDA